MIQGNEWLCYVWLQIIIGSLKHATVAKNDVELSFSDRESDTKEAKRE
jgi:hypothetical protein